MKGLSYHNNFLYRIIIDFDEINSCGEITVAHLTTQHVKNFHFTIVTTLNNDAAAHALDDNILHIKIVNTSIINSNIAIAIKKSCAIGYAVSVGDGWSAGGGNDKSA